MNQRQLVRSRLFELGLQERTTLDQILACKEQRVLGIPPLHLAVLPNTFPDEVHRKVFVLPKKSHPFVLPLLINVVSTTLKRNRCGEQDDRSQVSQTTNEDRCTISRQVLCHLQRYCQVEDAIEAEVLRQVARLEGIQRNL